MRQETPLGLVGGSGCWVGAGRVLGAEMAELEGPEVGKADFVLLDEVTMEQFVENLRLRYGAGLGTPQGASGCCRAGDGGNRDGEGQRGMRKRRQTPCLGGAGRGS